MGGGGRKDENGFLIYTRHYRCDTEIEALTVGDATVNGIPQKKGGRSWSPLKSGRWAVVVEYEGFPEDEEEPDPEAPENFEWLPTKSEEPIEAHPFIDRLLKDYAGWIDPETKKAKFPRYLKSESDPDGLAGNEKKAADQKPNPMFGRETYLLKGGILRWNLTTKERPDQWAKQDGRIVKSVPGDWETPDNRDWLVMFGPVRTRGSGDSLAYESKIDFLLSEDGGHPPPHFLFSDR